MYMKCSIRRCWKNFILTRQNNFNSFCTSTNTSIGDDEDAKSKLLYASLKKVTEFGWTDDAIMKGIEDIGLSPIAFKILPRGAIELVDFFLKNRQAYVKMTMETDTNELDKKMTKEASDNNDESIGDDDVNHMPLRDQKLYKAIMAHMEYTKPFKSIWPDALALIVEPQNIPNSFNILSDHIEDISNFAQIETARMDWYSERLALVSLYISTELFMIQDESNDLQSTR
jgi:ubiquinone biosynthesis protein COQ9